MDLLALHHFLGNDDQSQVMQIINLFRHIPQIELNKGRRLIPHSSFKNVIEGNFIEESPKKKTEP